MYWRKSQPANLITETIFSKQKKSLVSSTCTRWFLTHNLTLHPFFLCKEEVSFELELIGKTMVLRCSQNKEKWREKIWLRRTYTSPKNKFLKRQYWYGNVPLKLCALTFITRRQYTNKLILSWKTFFLPDQHKHTLQDTRSSCPHRRASWYKWILY